MASERVIENNVIRNQAVPGFTGAPFIRRCRAGRGYGIVDLLFLPSDGPHDVVLVEAKRTSSADAMAKVVGQLLLYCAGLSRFGSDGLQLLRQFAVNSPQKARSLTRGPSGIFVGSPVGENASFPRRHGTCSTRISTSRFSA
jgi:hypothetical protein